jgi:hypoxia up-regulated 1
LNTLEAFTYRARDYLEDESFIAALSDSARKELEKQLASTSEWLYGEGLDAKLQDFKDKLKSLRNLVDPVLKRKDESAKRPTAVKALKEGLENLNGMITMVEGSIKKAAEAASSSASEAAASPSPNASASSSVSVAEGEDLDEDPYSTNPAAEAAQTDDPPPFKPYEYTNEDLSALTTKYDEVKKWLDEKLALQDKLGQHDDPAFLVSELESRGQELQRLVSETIMKTIKMQDMPKKAKASGGKKGAKGKPKKSKSSSVGASNQTGSDTSTTAASASSSTVTISSPKVTKSVKDEL